MNVETEKPVFKPVKIVLETPEEVAKFYAIMNYSPIVETLNSRQRFQQIRSIIQELCPEIHSTQQTWYNRLRKHVHEIEAK